MITLHDPGIRLNGNRTPVTYRCENAAGRTIYVGATTNPRLRMRNHSQSSPWWHEVATVHVYHGDERAEIVRFRPEHNRLWNPDYYRSRGRYFPIMRPLDWRPFGVSA